MIGLDTSAFSESCPQGYMYNFTNQKCEPYGVFGDWVTATDLSSSVGASSSKTPANQPNGQQQFLFVVVLMFLVVLVTVGVTQLIKAIRKTKK